MFGPTRDSFNSHSDSPSKFPKDGPTLWWISNAFILSSEKGQLDMWFMMGLVCEILERRHMRSKYYLQAIENGMQVEFGKNKKRAMTNMHTEYRHTHVTTYCRHTDTHTHKDAQVPKIPIQHRRVQFISSGNCSGCYDNLNPQKAQKAEKNKSANKDRTEYKF